VQVFAGRDPLTGRKRWLSRQVRGQTKTAWREAKKIEAQLLEQVDRGEHRGSRTRTVGELVERWLEWRQQVRPISPVTVANYRGAIDRYITPNLGRAKVGEVDAATLDTLYARVRATGGKCRVSASAVREMHTVLSGAFNQAVVWGWTTHNPVRLATPPAAGRAEVAPPDAEGVARLLTAAMDQDPELGLFLRLAVVLGARRSELVGLKWRDVDLDAGEVLIASGVVRVAANR
jgi:integrase